MDKSVKKPLTLGGQVGYKTGPNRFLFLLLVESWATRNAGSILARPGLLYGCTSADALSSGIFRPISTSKEYPLTPVSPAAVQEGRANFASSPRCHRASGRFYSDLEAIDKYRGALAQVCILGFISEVPVGFRPALMEGRGPGGESYGTGPGLDRRGFPRRCAACSGPSFFLVDHK